MIIGPSMPSGYVLFCDDIREEVGGKVTFVGSYANEMQVHGSFPAAIPLAALIVYREDPKLLPRRISIRMTLAGTEEVLLSNFEIDLPSSDGLFPMPDEDPESIKFAEVRAHFKTIVTFTENAKIKIRAYMGEDELRLGTLNVRLTGPDADSDAPERD